MKFSSALGIATFALLAGCADEALKTADGNQALGIATFTVDENASTITVIGFDATGGEVGRAELTHGVFTLSDAYREYYSTPQVDGRKLDVKVLGHHYWLEHQGYEPMMHMPALPGNESELTAFLADPHVKPILARWDLGFEIADASADEDAYVTYTNSGSLVQSCDSSTNCGSLVRTGTNAGTYTVNTCGGGAAAMTANRIAVTSTTVDEVSQCCPAGSLSGSPAKWYGRKQCPKSGLTTPNCGNAAVGSACVGCATIEVSGCYVSYTGTGVNASWTACTPMGNYSTDCLQDNGCGGVFTSYRYPQPTPCEL